MGETAHAQVQNRSDASKGGSVASRLHPMILSNLRMFHRTHINGEVILDNSSGSVAIWRNIVHSPNGVRSYTDFRRKLGRKMNFWSKSSLPPTAPEGWVARGNRPMRPPLF